MMLLDELLNGREAEKSSRAVGRRLIVIEAYKLPRLLLWSRASVTQKHQGEMHTH